MRATGIIESFEKMKFSSLVDRMEATVFFVVILKFVGKYFEIRVIRGCKLEKVFNLRFTGRDGNNCSIHILAVV